MTSSLDSALSEAQWQKLLASSFADADNHSQSLGSVGHGNTSQMLAILKQVLIQNEQLKSSLNSVRKRNAQVLYCVASRLYIISHLPYIACIVVAVPAIDKSKYLQ